jgi:ribosomal protein L11 methyltransferase
MEYLELDCRVHPGGDNTEILIAYLGAIGYSMFEETDYGVKAYIETELFSQEELDSIPILNEPERVRIDYSVAVPEKRNWNQEWESNFQPVFIGKEIYVRAEYHQPDTSAPFELIIQPRMAFGTGHHATTSMIMEAMLDIEMDGKTVLDMGCGSGILAILASKMGAASVTAVDNDPNAVENAALNCTINKTIDIIVLQGDAATPGKTLFDVILANINRNIILNDLQQYAGNLVEKGLLVTSGYYIEDLPVIAEKAKLYGLSYKDHATLDNWCRTTFVKES